MAYVDSQWCISKGDIANTFKVWQYFSTTDSIATQRASGYFDTRATDLTVGDRIMLRCSDGQIDVYVTAVSPNVTTAPISVVGDFDLAQGAIIIGNASGKGVALTIGSANTLLKSNGTTLSYGTLSTANIGNQQVTQDKIDQTMLRGTSSFFIDGKMTTAVWAANLHPKAQLVRAYARLLEVPDASSTTYTVLIQNATGTVSMTNTLTFTQGTDAAGKVKAFTPITAGAADQIQKGDILNIVTAGTTTTAGEVEVILEFLGIA